MSASKPIPSNHPDTSLTDWEKIIKNDNDHSSSAQFTRRHYIWLTAAMREVLKQIKETEEYPAIDAVKAGISIFAEVLKNDNPNFDRQKFLANVFHPNSENQDDR